MLTQKHLKYDRNRFWVKICLPWSQGEETMHVGFMTLSMVDRFFIHMYSVHSCAFFFAVDNFMNSIFTGFTCCWWRGRLLHIPWFNRNIQVTHRFEMVSQDWRGGKIFCTNNILQYQTYRKIDHMMVINVWQLSGRFQVERGRSSAFAKVISELFIIMLNIYVTVTFMKNNVITTMSNNHCRW